MLCKSSNNNDPQTCGQSSYFEYVFSLAHEEAIVKQELILFRHTQAFL